MNFAKFLRTLFSQVTSGRLLLKCEGKNGGKPEYKLPFSCVVRAANIEYKNILVEIANIVFF